MFRIPLIIYLLLLSTAMHADESSYTNDVKDVYKRMKHHHGGEPLLFLMADRLEYQTHEGEPLTLWDTQGWYGNDINKFWFKSEGEYNHDANQFEEAEVQALYSRAVTSFWDFQTGIRHDVKPNPSRTYAVAGFQGIAPYWFEIDASAFISEKGKLSTRIEAEYELLLTQRLILQPRFEIELSLQDDKAIDSGSGINNINTGLRLRYEISREFAPYIGFNWNKAFGETERLLDASGEITEDLSFVAGLRMWY